ncbi:MULTISPECIES: SDR family NAD(P)-dependent oxidoreductase [Stutzerimonas]|uniref:SDR family oxidoreductase n=1 Tax=Stutzerimonas marianensis TaxID=2929513 RepID=A0A9X2AVM8_9GAMM|nr:SDR family NAD(P)-dependent oxidoreductase [Pseudomonas marianensis]MCJ0974812.1 SDR family oxidoreductase [Pseudomonas marianensis]
MYFNDLKGKRILITGATMGIGLATAKAFAALGAHVGITARNQPANLDSLLTELSSNGGEAAFFAGDLSRSQDCIDTVAAFVERFGGLDVLVNNAGALLERRGLEKIDDAFFDAMVDVNLRSALLVTREAIPHLRASTKASGQSASVITTGSIAAYNGGGPGASLYAAAKAWLHNVQRNWVREFAGDNIRFNVVAPGTVDTAFHADKDDAARAQVNTTIPLGRFGTSEEMAPAYLFLASHACSGYITGQTLDVNGGQAMP